MRKDNPNYGPGSISTVAKGRVANLKAQEAAEKKPSLLNALTGGPMSPSAKAIADRDAQQKALKKEVGGRR